MQQCLVLSVNDGDYIYEEKVSESEITVNDNLYTYIYISNDILKKRKVKNEESVKKLSKIKLI